MINLIKNILFTFPKISELSQIFPQIVDFIVFYESKLLAFSIS